MDAPYCKSKCGNKVWVNFGEDACLWCLNCIWTTDIPINISDAIFGRPSRVAILIQYKDSILVHRRGSKITCPGQLSINSGTMEDTDISSFDALERELYEEAMLRLSSFDGELIRLSKTLYWIQLSDNDYNKIDIDKLMPAPGFEEEVDGKYMFIPISSIAEQVSVSKLLFRVLATIERFRRFTARTYSPIYNNNVSCQDLVVLLNHTTDVFNALSRPMLTVSSDLEHKPSDIIVEKNTNDINNCEPITNTELIHYFPKIEPLNHHPVSVQHFHQDPP
jgi:hypothetical protein